MAAMAIQPMERSRSFAIALARLTLRLVIERSLTTAQAALIQRTAILHCPATPPGPAIQSSEIMRWQTIPPAATISPWAIQQALLSRQRITLFASAPQVRTSTAAILARSSVQHFPEELPCSLMQTADSAPLTLPGALKKRLSQWSGPAKWSLRSHLSHSTIRKRLIPMLL